MSKRGSDTRSRHRRYAIGWLMAGAIAYGGVVPVAAQASYVVVTARPQSPPQPTQPAGATTLVTLSVRDSTIKYVVRELARQAGLKADFYDSPALSRRITVDAVNKPVMVVLNEALHGTGLESRVLSNGVTLSIHPRTQPVGAHQDSAGIVAGRVVDSASGQGLGGVAIKVAGTTRSAITSDSGNFTVRAVPSGEQVLTARLFGYHPVDRTVTVVDSQRTMIRIVMASVPTVLSGVVTTATGLQRKIAVGNDITSLNVDSIMQVAPVSTVTDLLESRVPGLTVVHSTGEPGAPSRLRLRGIGSITGNNDPVVIVNGVRVYSSQSDPRNDNLAQSGIAGQSYSAPSPIDQIDPNNIETIEVFKGPSASALYGSDAASGVIVITTKHGRAGPTHWSLDLGDEVNWIPGEWPVNYYRFGTNVTNSSVNPFCNWYDPTCVVIDSLVAFQALNDSRYTVLSHGGGQTAALTVSGGTPTLQYSVSGSGSGTEGNLKLPVSVQQDYTAAYGAIPRWMVRPDQYTDWGVSGSATAHPTQSVQVVVQSSLFNSAQQTSSLQGALATLEGVYISQNGYAYDAQDAGNPLAGNAIITNYFQRVTEVAVTNTNTLSLSWQPESWLPLTATGGVQAMQRTDRAYIPYGVNVSEIDTTGYYSVGRGNTDNNTVSAGTVLPFLHQRVQLALGGNMYTGTVEDLQVKTFTLAPGVSVPSTLIGGVCATNCGSAEQASSASATYGWYFEPRLNVNSRFFVAPGFRLDGGSGGTHATTGGGGGGGLSAFPKIDLSYVAVDRQGERPLWGVLTLVRPRLAFGLAGTQPSPEDRLRLYNVGGGLDLGGQGDLVGGECEQLQFNYTTTLPGVCLSSLGNSQLRPERSSELEGGVDATLWRGRLALTLTKYRKVRNDAIISIPIAPSISDYDGSAFNVAENIGEVRNTGTELTANAALLQSRALSWNVGMNLTNNNNLLVHLNPGQAPNYIVGLVPGYPLFGRWVTPIVGFADLNHDKIIEQNEIFLGDSLVYAGGDPNPKYQLNLTTDIHLLGGRLGVYGTFAYQNGMTQLNQAASTSSSVNLAGNNPNTSLAYQAAELAAKYSLTNYGLIQTVNTLRFQSLSINYELPRRVSAWLKVPRATVAVQGQNLGLHTNYRGKDPDVNAFSTVSSGDETADLGQIPEPRTWWLKLTLGN